jgi:succinyl-diaminopimelate desuccinylase
MNQEKFLIDLAELVEIPSVRDLSTANEEAPFGQEIKNAMDKMTQIAIKDGFNVQNINNKTLEINMVGTQASNEDIGVLGHLDVVPVGDINKWNTPPFKVTQKGDLIYGRGVTDDKGTMLVAYYAARGVVKNNENNGKNIRIILGGAEETTWECVDDYFKNKPEPKMSFSPDSDFPVVNGEKGMMVFDLKLKNIDFSKIQNLTASNIYNAVPDFASIVIDGKEIKYDGVTAHSSLPEKGINAIDKMFTDLISKQNELGIHEEMKQIQKVIEILINDIYGLKLGLESSHNKVGKTTTNFGVISYDGNKKELKLGVSLRLTLGMTIEKAEMILKDKFADISNSELSIHKSLNAFYYPEEEKLVKSLLSAYNEVMNENAVPLCVGGSTYAKALSNCVAFGALFEGFDPKMHEANEVASLSNFAKAYEIYYKALVNLCNVED